MTDLRKSDPDREKSGRCIQMQAHSFSYHRKVLGLKVARKNNPPKGGHGKADDG